MVASVARKMKKPTNRKRKLKTKTNLKTFWNQTKAVHVYERCNCRMDLGFWTEELGLPQ